MAQVEQIVSGLLKEDEDEFDVLDSGSDENSNEGPFNYADAVDFADKLADELEDEGWKSDRSWASHSNHYAIKLTNGSHERYIEVVKVGSI